MYAARQALRLTITQTVPKTLGAVGLTHWCPLTEFLPPPRRQYIYCAACRTVERYKRTICIIAHGRIFGSRAGCAHHRIFRRGNFPGGYIAGIHRSALTIQRTGLTRCAAPTLHRSAGERRTFGPCSCCPDIQCPKSRSATSASKSTMPLRRQGGRKFEGIAAGGRALAGHNGPLDIKS